ncbi:MAG: glycosyltransferase family 2 protein [Anaerolineaceae bacterium]|nr:glycosyltransferase family 2 protein [Anaerolineaceae bacterium]
MDKQEFDVEVLLPVHNEANIIEKVIREIYTEFSPRIKCQFIICEDGSSDNSQEVITQLSHEIPMKLIFSTERKGYSKAVKDGMLTTTAPYLLCLDSDGQCDPADFWKFWDSRQDYDVILGWRKPRRDASWRLFFSHMFFLVYQLFFHVPFHDPSCPFMLAKKDSAYKIGAKMGAMQQGFWWEFVARVKLANLRTKEVEINHRDRMGGKTQVYKLSKVPGIGIKHFLALFTILKDGRRND